jgi:hypothetical protein
MEDAYCFSRSEVKVTISVVGRIQFNSNLYFKASTEVLSNWAGETIGD